MGVHEYGFDGTVQVKQFTRHNPQGDRFRVGNETLTRRQASSSPPKKGKYKLASSGHCHRAGALAPDAHARPRAHRARHSRAHPQLQRGSQPGDHRRLERKIVNENNLTRAQQDIADRLNNDEWFATIPVFTDRKANIVSEVQKSLGAVTLKGGKVGTCAVVLQPQATAARSNIPIATMDLEITVLVLEDPQVNNGQTGTGKDRLEHGPPDCRCPAYVLQPGQSAHAFSGYSHNRSDKRRDRTCVR